MRIAYLMTASGWGGAETQVFMLAREMRQRDHDVIVVTLNDEPNTLLPRFAEASIACISLGMNERRLLPSALVRAARWFQEWRPDVLHSHMVHANIFGRLIRLFVPVPVVVSTAHSINEGSFLRTIAYRLTDRLADLTTHVSPDAVAAYVRKGACPKSRIMHVANGLDLERFKPDPQARARVRREMCLVDDVVFLAVGRLFPVKDYPTMIEAFDAVHRRRPDAHLLIAGEGPCRAELESVVASLPSGTAIRMLGLRQDIPDLMNAADCFVMSSLFEGAPMVLIEAMACGKSIVTTEFTGVKALLGGYGLVVPGGQPEWLSRAMLEVAERRQIVNQGVRDRAESLFSISAVADTWESIYRRLWPAGPGVLNSATRVGLRP